MQLDLVRIVRLPRCRGAGKWLSTGWGVLGEFSTEDQVSWCVGVWFTQRWSMTWIEECPAELAEVLRRQDQVAEVSTVRRYLTAGELRWQVSSGRWQQPCRGIVVTHSGPLTEVQRLWTAVLGAGGAAVIAGLTAAKLDGFRWYAGNRAAESPVYLLHPAGRPLRHRPPGIPVVVHYSTALGPADVHPLREPPRTRIARSIIDAASWMATDRGAQAVLAAGVQQRLVRVQDLLPVVEANQRLHRRRLIGETLGDIAGGAQALSELDFTRLVVRGYGLPQPDRQACRPDSQGRRRYLDVLWEDAKVVVEIDGAQHMDPLEYWDDMNRANDLQLKDYEVLRFPAWVVRYHPGFVAAEIRRAFRKAAERARRGAA
jgi:hypothetical protein